jgi:hypothetical protein
VKIGSILLFMASVAILSSCSGCNKKKKHISPDLEKIVEVEDEELLNETDTEHPSRRPICNV